MKIKDLFQTPKRAAIATFCIVSGAGIISAGTVAVTASVAESNSIGRVAAENAALADAGVNYADARFSRTDFEFERGRYVYEVEFTAAGMEYDYQIKASDGNILARKREPADGVAAQTSGTQRAETAETQNAGQAAEPVAEEAKMQKTTQNIDAAAQATPQSAVPAADIGVEGAKEKALADAGEKASDVTFLKERADWDDGVYVYDIEFYTAQTEYEYEIEAATGNVRSRSAETFVVVPAQAEGGNNSNKNIANSGKAAQNTTEKVQAPAQAVNNNSAYISVDQAKSIALSHAGKTAGDVVFKKTKMENDDGRTEYEVEFYQGRTEYDYTIDAVSGTILEYDFDYDD